MNNRPLSPITLSKLAITAIALGYLAYLTLGLFFGYLGPNPVEVITHKTGEWGLHFLLLTLTVTPLRRHFHWNSLLKLRRFLGLWSFAFISVHLLVYVLFDHFFDWLGIIEDIVERPYITVGFLGFLCLLPLAVTSLRYWQKRLGKNWIRLHRLTYLVGILGVIHYWWLVKADVLWPMVYGLVLLVLLGARLWFACKKRWAG